MNSRERVFAALRRQPVDRVPIFMWYHPETALRLGRVLEIPASRVAAAFGDDIAQTWVGNNQAMEGIVHEHDGEGHTDPWGVRWVKDGMFNQIAAAPLSGASPEALRAYRFPDVQRDELLSPMAALAAAVPADLFLGCDVSPCVFELYWRLRGMEQALIDLAETPEQTAEMLARCADFSVRLAEAACRRFRLDWLWTGDDVGGQGGMMMSPDQWRSLVRPHLARVVQVGTARDLIVAYHSCGAIRSIIPDLIEIGVDVLNPIQCNCPGMDPLELKREYGRELAFMGGVDTQGLLPRGSADDVRRATERLLTAMTADGGGFILAASHTVPPETPDANIFAMYAAAGVSRTEVFDRAAKIRKR